MFFLKRKSKKIIGLFQIKMKKALKQPFLKQDKREVEKYFYD